MYVCVRAYVRACVRVCIRENVPACICTHTHTHIGHTETGTVLNTLACTIHCECLQYFPPVSRSRLGERRATCGLCTVPVV